MKILKIIKHSALTLLMALGICFGFSTTTWADTASSTSGKQLAVVDAEYDDLSVQFRYIDKNLSGIRFLNLSSKAIELHFLDNNYVLDSGDYVVIDPPKLGTLMFSYEPYVPYKTGLSDLLSSRFTKEYFFIVPKNQNDTVKY